MKIPDLIMTANNNLRRSKLRTFLTILAIVIGAFTLAMSIGLGEGIRSYIKSQIGSFEDANLYRVSRAGGANIGAGFSSPEPKVYEQDKAKSPRDVSQLLLTEDEIAKIAGTKSVNKLRLPYAVTVEYIVGSDGNKYEAPGDIAIPEITKTYLAGGQLPEDAMNKILLSNKYLSTIGAANPSEAVGKSVNTFFKAADGRLVEYNFEIVGVIAPSIFDQPINMSEKQAKEIAELQRGPAAKSFTGVFVSKADGATDAELKAEIAKLNLEAGSFKDALSTLNSIITGAQIGLAAFSVIAIMAAAVGLVNTLFMAVLERTKEIGLYRALGARRKTIFSLFTLEAALIGLWGAGIGLIVANIARLGINSLASNTFLKGVQGYNLLNLPLRLHLLIIVSIMLVTLIAGLLPALKASRLSPIDALKYE